MTSMAKSACVGAIQLGLLFAVAGKFAYDRATFPRRWVPVRMVDPDSLLRGRYLVLQSTEDAKLRFEYFVPENLNIVPKPGEQLWAEVTLAPNGPRPIRVELRAR